MNQSGNPVLVRCEPKGSPALNQAWGSGGPIAGVVDKILGPLRMQLHLRQWWLQIQRFLR
jgi:hypothetical protein